MDPMASPPVSDPTTPDRIFAHTRHTETPNKSTATFYPRSQPVGSTQRALQASLTNNIVFANEAIVHAIFQPSKVDDQTVVDILTKINDDNSLKAARRSALSGKVVEATKYKSIVCHRILVSERANLNLLAYAARPHHDLQSPRCPAGKQGLWAPCTPNLGEYTRSEHPNRSGDLSSWRGRREGKGC